MNAADAASAERQAILRKVRRMMKAAVPEADRLKVLEEFILTRDDRYNKRRGGLGKK